MSNIVEYTLSLQDKLSAKLQTIGVNSTGAAEKFEKLKAQTTKASQTMNEMGGSLGALREKLASLQAEKEWIPASQVKSIRAYTVEIKNLETEISKLENTGKHENPFAGMFGGGFLASMGISAGFYKVGEMMHDGVEKAHELHAAEAQVRAGLLSTKGAAGVAFEDIEKVVNRVASSSLYSKGELMDMQSILVTFPDVTSKTFGAASQAIADMSSRMHQDLKSSAVEVGKALQDPLTGITALRRIGVNFDKEQTEVIKNLVKNGHKAEAQQRILTELNNEFGGSAKAAFNADPLARYNKAIGAIKIELGKVIIHIQSKLAPILEAIANLFLRATKAVKPFFKWLWNTLQDGNPIIIGIATAIGSMAAIIGIVSLATKAWTVVQWMLNTSLFANPVVWIIAGIIALIAIIAVVIYKVDGWGKTWHNIMTWMGIGIELFKESVSFQWLAIKDVFLTGFEIIETGWYKLQSLWDKKSANAGLSTLEKQRNDRAKEIAASAGKMKSLVKQMATMKVFELSWNNKKLGDVTKGLKKTLGIPASTSTDTGGGTGAIGGGNGSGDGDGLTKASDTITGGGKNMKSITINLGSLIHENTNNFNKGDNPADAQDFMSKLSTALQLVVNDVNYS
jgi:hypothetical protein